MMNQTQPLTELLLWLEDNMARNSDLHFDNDGKVDSNEVYQALVLQLATLPPCEAFKRHLTLSHALLAQVIHLLRIPMQGKAWAELEAVLNRQGTSLFVSPNIQPEPYREFHYYHDDNNVLWALLVIDEQDAILDAYLHPEWFSDAHAPMWLRTINTQEEGV
ncbi:hypothetical protein AAFX24_18030 [Vibrio mediterranei]